MSIALVTDSTASLPEPVAGALGVEVVPLHVSLGDDEFEEGHGIDAATLAERMRRKERAATSRPTPAALLAAYERLAERGASGILSVHLSAELSGTAESAHLAVRHAPVPVTVVDSRAAGRATGYAVEDAAACLRAGGDLAAAADAARASAEASTTFFYVDSLDWLRRGGRIGAAAAFIGSALLVKPLLALEDGHIEPLEKARTAGRALTRLEELTLASVDAAGGRARVAVQHLDADSRATALRDAIAARCPGCEEVDVLPVSAVLGAHVGPGMVAVTVSPLPDLG